MKLHFFFCVFVVQFFASEAETAFWGVLLAILVVVRRVKLRRAGEAGAPCLLTQRTTVTGSGRGLNSLLFVTSSLIRQKMVVRVQVPKKSAFKGKHTELPFAKTPAESKKHQVARSKAANKAMKAFNKAQKALPPAARK